jgi:SNF2 family DNA or RNA helicase
MSIQEIISIQKERLASLIDKRELAKGEEIYNKGLCQLLSQSAVGFELIVSDEAMPASVEYRLDIELNGNIVPCTAGTEDEWDRYSYGCLLQVENDLQLTDPKENILHKKYTREGMINRVMKERLLKADKANYHIEWADNIYGDHILTNENGVKYKIFLRDFEKENGYSNSMDSRLNKLGTTKHIMHAFRRLKDDKILFGKLDKTYPFIEIFCDPLNDYRITWFYPRLLPEEEQSFISSYFKNSSYIADSDVTKLLGLITGAGEFPHILIRPEVVSKIESAFEKKMLSDISNIRKADFNSIKADLYPYQKEGIQFALFRKVSIIADEMGLGKTIQAIGTAILKKEILGFSRTLIVCPASLKEQWRSEIEKFTNENAIVINGTPKEREMQYKNDGYFFFIVNYETVLRDHQAMNKAGFDILILDEAQRAKNYETLTASSLKRLDVKHKVVITGTPIENRLIDIFSIMSILDPEFFGPLWEFSYQHCLFDPEKPNKINGYYNLQILNKKLEEVLIRREKRKVMSQLPNIRQITIPVNLSPMQAEFHASYAKGLSKIIRKKFLTPYDLQKMQLLLANMRMVCDSTFLIDDSTNESPKMEELKYVLFEKMEIQHKDAKIIIFSEWVKVHQLIGKLLRENKVGFVELNGKVPVKMRGELIHKFESNPEYKVFLSTEAGGTGLNLQIADTIINFELPWNPARKNQRTGRIDRIGQKSNMLTIYSFITRNSIEEQIASGLLVKQSLFDGVLGDNKSTNFVDFSTKGRSQFIQQLEAFIVRTEKQDIMNSLQLTDKPVEAFETLKVPEEIDFTEEVPEPTGEQLVIEPANIGVNQTDKNVQLEAVMNSGMQFLAGLFKMTTGKDLGLENQKVEVDKITGEIIMRFKIPV